MPTSPAISSPTTTPSAVKTLIILGGGASGLMCAWRAARRGIPVIVLEQAPKVGRKIAISGGGRCNFTNRTVGVQDYVTSRPEFCEPALDAWQPENMLAWCKSHGLIWEEREHGRVFGLQSAERLVDALAEQCHAAGARIHTRCRVDRLIPPQEGQALFTVACTLLDEEGQPTQGREWRGKNVVIALGSPAWPAVGATDKGLFLARSVGHGLRPLRPVLSPLLMPQNWPLRHLTGISSRVTISVGGQQFTDDLLFTHQGISGPAALLASCHWQAGTPMSIDFLPTQSFMALLDAPECGKLLVKNLLARHLPQRLAQLLLPEDLGQRKVAELSRKHRILLADCVHAHTISPTGTGGLRKAEAAAGGVKVEEVDGYTMQSLRVPGLYLTGEVLDVAGHLGGYNLHWAFASGILAGDSIV